MLAQVIENGQIPNNDLIDYEDKLVTGNLTSDGIQWSAEIDTTAINTDVEVLSVTIEPKIPGDILWIEFGLTTALKAVSTGTADLIWKWQARNKNGTWVNLHTAVTETDIGATYVERTRQGYFTLVTNFNSIPFDIRLILQCNEANEGRGKVKNSSYVRTVYKP